MKLVSGIVDSGFFAQSALSAEVATKDSLGRNISETYLTAVDIPESAVWNATTQTVSANSAQWAGGTANPQIPVTGINGIKISESGDKVVFEVSANYATEDWVTGQGYLTAETDWSDTITAASANAYNEATAAIPAPFDPSYLSGQIDTKLDSAIYAEDSGKFLTALPQDLVYTADIQDMATTGDLTSKQDITGMTAYATVESLTAKQDAGDYLSATDSANFLLTSDSGNFYPMNQNPSGYLTAHQSLADYQTTADMVNYQTTAGMTAYLTAVPDTYLQNTDLSTEDGKVTAISGIPLSAGGDVPEGVMVESGLEYNAVNEISGYNGSAIAQYGAEKQWLQHDDTLVHASNSAQYALGVNLSAVAQLLGVDETVLFSASTGTQGNVTLSEPYTSFKRFKVEYSIGHTNDQSTIQYDYGSKIIEFNSDNIAHSTKFSLSDMMPNGTGAGGLTSNVIRRKDFSANNTEFKVMDSYQLYWNGSWSWNNNNQVSVLGVTGIGRKQ